MTVYERAAFVKSLPYPVLPTRRLFAWWREENRQAIREAVLGPDAADDAHRRGEHAEQA